MEQKRLSEIRQKVHTQKVIGYKDVQELLFYVDELRGTELRMQMDADEAALTRARLESEIAALKSEGESHLFENLAHANAFEELKRRDAVRLGV